MVCYVGDVVGENANAPLVGGPHTYRDVRSIQRDAHRAKLSAYLRLGPTAGVLAQAGKGCGSWLEASWHIPMMYRQVPRSGRSQAISGDLSATKKAFLTHLEANTCRLQLRTLASELPVPPRRSTRE